MKRIISAILCVLMLASFATVAAFAAPEGVEEAPIVGQTATTKDFVVFDFTVEGQAGVGGSPKEANAMWWGKAKRFDTEYISADSCTRLKFVDPNGDQNECYFTACIPTALQFDPSEFKYLKIYYRCDPELVESECYSPEFLFGMSNYQGTGGEYVGQWNADMALTGLEPYVCDNQWQEYILDLTDNAFWDKDPEYGSLSEIRLDVFNSSDNIGAYLDIKYIAFLKTEEDAERFGINELGKFALLEAKETTAAEETTVAETTAAEVVTTAAEVATTAAEVATTVAEKATAAEAATTKAAEAATTAAAETKTGCGSTVGIISVVAVLGMGLVSFKKKHN